MILLSVVVVGCRGQGCLMAAARWGLMFTVLRLLLLLLLLLFVGLLFSFENWSSSKLGLFYCFAISLRNRG